MAGNRTMGLLLLLGLILAAGGIIQWNAHLNHDVAWFAWGADRMLGGAVIGRDLLDPNFPLAYIIYFPAALLGKIVGISAGLKISVLLLTGLSTLLVSRSVPGGRGVALAAALAAFSVLAMPREFGQREHIAFLLIAPYCVEGVMARRRAIVVGVLAGIGFALKPHFLIALLLVEIGRPLLRTEQKALIATGALYALALMLFFPTFLFEMLPLTRQVYWGFDIPFAWQQGILPAALVLACLALARREGSATAWRFALAGTGFVIAGIAQGKMYPYQLLPGWGLILLSVVALFPMRDRYARVSAMAIGALVIGSLAGAAWSWMNDGEGRHRQIPRLLAVVDGAESFAVVSVHPYPAFPVAIYSPSRFVGVASSHWFLPAAAKGSDRGAAEARLQMRRDLYQSPEIVLVDTNWRRHTATSLRFDGLKFLLNDPQTAKLWKNYRLEGMVGAFQVYRDTRDRSSARTPRG